MTVQGIITDDLVKARELATVEARTLRPLRTERTTRSFAKKIADLVWENPYTLFEKGMQKFEEQVLLEKIRPYLQTADLPDGWRRTYRMMWPDVRIHQQPCWPRFYTVARNSMAEMLGRHDISGVMKTRIYDAIMEDRNEKGN